MLNADKNRNFKNAVRRNVANKNPNIFDISKNKNGLQQQRLGQEYRKQPTARQTSKTDGKKRTQVSDQRFSCQLSAHATEFPRTLEQGPMPGAPNQWYTLSNRVHKHGTTIEMMYTGQAVPQTRTQLDIRAIPGVTRLTVELPPGVLPHIKNGTPDMPSLMNAMDFFKYPSQHLPDPKMGPSTIIQMLPKDKSGRGQKQNIDAIEVVPLGWTRSAPLRQTALNVAFQSYSLMQFEVDASQSKPPGRVVIDAEISPAYLLSTHQQLRLQSAVMQRNLPLTEALMPIVKDLYEEHEKLQQAGLRLLPAPEPLPYGTMSFRYIDSPIFGGAPVPEAPTPPYIVQEPRGQTEQGSDDIDVGPTMMALDPYGNYRPMLISEWSKLKQSQ